MRDSSKDGATFSKSRLGFLLHAIVPAIPLGALFLSVVGLLIVPAGTSFFGVFLARARSIHGRKVFSTEYLSAVDATPDQAVGISTFLVALAAILPAVNAYFLLTTVQQLFRA